MLILGVCLLVLSCREDALYAPCESPGDCEVPEGREAACADKEGDGFCSWLCDEDEDCAHEDDDLVCASFEENPDKYCFPSCGGGAGCPDGFECRSTGGGVSQRMVCFPN